MADAPASQRDLAVARSLGSARLRAEHRVQRFLDAATELLREGAGREFTVQEVVERSGQSLRSFYQYFGGKHELLLALFEDSIRATADHLRAEVADAAEPIDRLHDLVIGYYRLCRVQPSRASKKAPGLAMSEFAQQLLTSHPDEATRAFVPMVELFDEALAAAAGSLRDDLERERTVGVLLESIMFNPFARTISGGPAGGADDVDEDAETLWRLFFGGMAR
jgi:AcrR family transcriptional regulator